MGGGLTIDVYIYIYVYIYIHSHPLVQLIFWCLSPVTDRRLWLPLGGREKLLDAVTFPVPQPFLTVACKTRTTMHPSPIHDAKKKKKRDLPPQSAALRSRGLAASCWLFLAVSLVQLRCDGWSKCSIRFLMSALSLVFLRGSCFRTLASC